jgi:hypothetical protein
MATRLGDGSDWPDAALYMDIDYYSLSPKFKIGLRPAIADFLNRSHETTATVRGQLFKMKLL